MATNSTDKVFSSELDGNREMKLYLITFLLTIGNELGVVAVIRRLVPSLRETPVLSACLCINLLTHPLASVMFVGKFAPFGVVESAVILAEASGYRCVSRAPWRWSIVLAGSANGLSMTAGLLVF